MAHCQRRLGGCCLSGSTVAGSSACATQPLPPAGAVVLSPGGAAGIFAKVRRNAAPILRRRRRKVGQVAAADWRAGLQLHTYSHQPSTRATTVRLLFQQTVLE